jgi:hypothetical protein
MPVCGIDAVPRVPLGHDHRARLNRPVWKRSATRPAARLPWSGRGSWRRLILLRSAVGIFGWPWRVCSVELPCGKKGWMKLSRVYAHKEEEGHKSIAEGREPGKRRAGSIRREDLEQFRSSRPASPPPQGRKAADCVADAGSCLRKPIFLGADVCDCHR